MLVAWGAQASILHFEVLSSFQGDVMRLRNKVTVFTSRKGPSHCKAGTTVGALSNCRVSLGRRCGRSGRCGGSGSGLLLCRVSLCWGVCRTRFHRGSGVGIRWLRAQSCW
jgi:hypothetical protein